MWCSYQLPVECAPGEYPIRAEQPSVVLSLGINTNGLYHLTQVDKVHELVHLRILGAAKEYKIHRN